MRRMNCWWTFNGCLSTDVTYDTLIVSVFTIRSMLKPVVYEMCAGGFSADASTASLLLDLLESQEQDPALLALHKKYLP